MIESSPKSIREYYESHGSYSETVFSRIPVNFKFYMKNQYKQNLHNWTPRITTTICSLKSECKPFNHKTSFSLWSPLSVLQWTVFKGIKSQQDRENTLTKSRRYKERKAMVLKNRKHKGMEAGRSWVINEEWYQQSFTWFWHGENYERCS